LYMRSFYANQAMDAKTKVAINYFISSISKTIFQQSFANQAMFALAANRFGNTAVAKTVIKGLQQNAITHPEQGMYWKQNTNGYAWHQASIENQCLFMECFDEIAKDKNAIDEMKIWLINNKQTNHWPTTKATAEAVYALMSTTSNATPTNSQTKVEYGNNLLNLNALVQEAGTGYTKTIIPINQITPNTANVSFENTDKKFAITFGSVYYQYLEDLDKIKSATSDIAITKKIMLVNNIDAGEVLQEVPANGITIGSTIRVKLVLTISKDMDYVHLKDMRAACFEPVNVLSGYKYNNGLGYYESTKDASTNFFFDHIAKGTYVFEYDVLATNKGTYQNGIANLECMYAPQFNAHSQGILVTVK
jgi:uncharacterized protein YfaS (alpha-2-macroglobulin family)